MPTVPRYDSFQVQESPLPSGEQQVALRPDAFGAAIGEGLGAIGKQVAEVAEQEVIKAEEISLLEAERKFQEWELKNVEAALNMRGKDAIALPDKFYPEMDRAVSDIAQSIPSERARLKFQERSLGKTRGISLTINRHVRSEIDQHDAAETQALIANSQQAAAMNYNDPERIAEEIDAQHEAILARAQRIGADSEVIEQLTTDATSKTHVGVVSRMLQAEQYGMAREYFDANSEDMLVEDRDSLKKAVLEAGVRAESTAMADQIMTSAGSRSEALKRVNDMEAGAVRDATRQRINQRFNEQEAAKAEDKAARLESAARLVQDSGGDINAIPPDMFAELDAGEIRDLKALSNFVRTGMPATDDRVIWAFSQMSDDQLLQTNLLATARPHMDDSHYYPLLQRQQNIREARNGNKDALAAVTATATFSQQFENAARMYGLIDMDKTVASDKNREKYLILQTRAQDAVELEERNKGRKLTPMEIRGVITGVFAETVNIAPTRQGVSGFFGFLTGAEADINAAFVEQDQYDRAYVPLQRIPETRLESYATALMDSLFPDRKMTELSPAELRMLNEKAQRLEAAYLIGDIALYNRILEDKE
jgi:hypothetical protein